jgi:hypothetical protein
VIKSFLISVLSLALSAAGFLTRPTEEEFRAHLKGSAKGLTYRDRYLWVQIEDARGAVQYTGVFSHWLRRGEWMPQRQGIERAAAK